MSAHRVKTMIVIQASSVSRCFFRRAKTVYEDECMKLESHFIGVKNTLKGTAPYTVLTGLVRIVSSFRRTKLRKSTAAAVTPISQALCGSDRGRITEQKRFPVPDMGKLEAKARATYENRQHLKRVAQQQNAVLQATRGHTGTRQTTHDPEPTPQPSYISTLPALDPNESHVERQRAIRESLTVILGEERMKFGVGFPSGHSGVDPVIAEHLHQKAIMKFWNCVDAQKVEERRVAEEEKQRFFQQEVIGLEIQILLHHARNRYMERIESLALFGPHLENGIDILEYALQYGDLKEAIFIAQSIIVDVLHPINAIFVEMSKEIFLEEEGARILTEKWPMGRLVCVLLFFVGASALLEEFQYFFQCLEAICFPLFHPTPFHSPLDPFPTEATKFHPQFAVGTNKSVVFATSTSSNIYPVPAPLAPAPPNDSNPLAEGSKNYTNFTKFTSASRDIQDKDRIPAPIIASLNPSDTQYPHSTSLATKQEILQYVKNNAFELDYRTNDLSKDGIISNFGRLQVSEVLQNLLDLANGRQRMISPGEGIGFENGVARIRRKIANLSSGKNNEKTRELDALALAVSSLWA